jgi:hypothetical protein
MLMNGIRKLKLQISPEKHINIRISTQTNRLASSSTSLEQCPDIFFGELFDEALFGADQVGG